MIANCLNAKLYFCGWSLFEQTLDTLKPKLVFDLGANEGGWIDKWLNRGAVVHAFEPVPDMAEKIRTKYGDNPRVILNQIAIGASADDLKDVNVCAAWALLPKSAGVGVALDYQNKPPFTAKQTTLDAYINATGTIPDFVKMDTDGYEYRALKGGEKFFRKHRPPMLFELSHLPTYLGDSVPEMCEFIYDLGYIAWSMNGSYCSPTAYDMIANAPENGSYDIMLLPR